MIRYFQAISSLALTMEMHLVDYIRTGSLIIAFVALLFVDRRLWITVDAVLSFAVGGALVVAPQYILDFQVCRTRHSSVVARMYYYKLGSLYRSKRIILHRYSVINLLSPTFPPQPGS